MRGAAKLRFVLLGVVSLCAVYTLVRRSVTADRHWYKREAPCQYSHQHNKSLSKLTDVIVDILQRKHVDFFLCYGSLYGALRLGYALPWDPDVEFCVYDLHRSYFNEDLLGWFEDNSLPITYDRYEDLFTIELENVRAEIVLFKYNDDFTRLERQLPFGVTDSFPSKLLAPPLEKRKFFRQTLPVPNDGIDIQRYFYPDDWWKPVKPVNCRHAETESGDR